MACAVSILAPARVKALLRGPTRDKVLVVDVRDSDFVGGHIKGAVNIVSHSFTSDSSVDSILERHCSGKSTVVVHCYLSQQRGPFCAQRLAERLEAAGRVQPEVCVMAGGWKRFRREIDVVEDIELVENFTD